MIKTFDVNLKYWDGSYVKRTKTYKSGETETVDVANYIEVSNVDVTPRNEIFVLLETGEEVDLSKGKLYVGGMEIIPLESAICNRWNLMLPLIKYAE